MRVQQLPNFFIIGAPKAGTTTLYNALVNVDGVFMSKVKEPGFFSSESNFQLGIDHYVRAFFKGAQGSPVRGEATPWYLYSSEARCRILLFCPHARILVSLRRPADRAYSMYRDQVAAGNEKRPFVVAVREEMAAQEASAVNDVRRRYLWASTYSPHLLAWQQAVGGARMLSVISEELSTAPTATWTALAQLLDHPLGPERLSDRSARERNVAGVARWPVLQQTMRSLEGRDVRAVNLVKSLSPGLHRQAAQALSSWNKRPAPRVDPPHGLLAQLDEFFAPEVAAIEAIIGRNVPLWHKDRPL